MSARVSVGVLVLAVGILCLAAPVAMSQEPWPMPGPSRPPVPSIAVVGSGTASGRPDTAEVTAGVIRQSATARQALVESSATMEKVLKAAARLGIAEKDIQTTNVSVVPQRRQERPGAQPPEIVGYEVSNAIRLSVRDLTILGRLLDELVGEGANALGGIRLLVADPAALLDEARTKAMADARRKAEVYVRAAGVKLGRVLFIQESSPGIPRSEGPRMLAAQAVPVAPGEQEFQVGVSVTYAIE